MSDKPQRYASLLRRISLAVDGLDLEADLAEAFELGRAFVEDGVPPDELMSIHHQALVELAQAQPKLMLADVAERLTAPLMEMSMAYGLAFRQQAEMRLAAMVEARMEHASRLQSVGTLAAGVAHDFNNIIGCIAGLAELVSDDLPAGSQAARNLEQILIASARARDLVQRLLAFARQRPAAAVEVSVIDSVTETLALLEPSLRKQVHLRHRFALREARIKVDPGSLQQIVMNLCLNANDAIEGEGEIEVVLTSAAATGRAPAGHEGDLCLLVRDSGRGMVPEVVAQVFDPFFTTKAPGEGSGLGLSVVHGIVTDLGGVIEVSSVASGSRTGTEFALFLPCLKLEPLPDKT